MASATAATSEQQQQEQTYKEFREAVNMTASELEKWLDTDESKSVGWKGEGGDDNESRESVGHESGRRIIEILHKKKADLSGDDYDHMNKVVGYVHRHQAQRPDGGPERLEHMNWTYSLKNWGHDPLKDSANAG